MRSTRKIKEIGVIFAGLLAVNLVEADMPSSGGFAGRVKTQVQRRSKGKANASRTPTPPTKQASKSGTSKTLAQSKSKSSANTPRGPVHLTSYLRFGDGTAYVTYSNGLKLKRRPALGRPSKISGKISRQLV
jgi:hypothetical protein